MFKINKNFGDGVEQAKRRDTNEPFDFIFDGDDLQDHQLVHASRFWVTYLKGEALTHILEREPLARRDGLGCEGPGSAASLPAGRSAKDKGAS